MINSLARQYLESNINIDLKLPPWKTTLLFEGCILGLVKGSKVS